MSVREINHFGNSCHGDSPNILNPGHPLSFDPLHQIYGEDGDGTDLGFYDHSDFIPVDELPDPQTEDEDTWFGMSIIDIPAAEDLPGDDDDFPAFKDDEPDIELFALTANDECHCIGQCGRNHKNRDPKVHSRKGQHFLPGRHSHTDHRRLARNRRQSIRRASSEVLHALSV